MVGFPYFVKQYAMSAKETAKLPVPGEFMHKDLIPNNASLENSVTSLEGEDKQLFLDFMKKVLHWLPEDRQSAKELVEHPWLAQ